MASKPVKSRGPRFDEVRVVPAAVDDDLDHGQNQQPGGPGAGLEKKIGLCRGMGKARIDDQQLGAALFGPNDSRRVVDRRSKNRIVADEQDRLSLFIMGLGETAEGGAVGDGPGKETEVGVGEDAGRTPGVHQTQHVVVVGHPSRRMSPVKAHASGAVASLDLLHATGDFFQGRFPGDRLPAAFSPAAGSPKRGAKPVGIGDQLGRGQRFGAEAPVVDRVFRLAVDAQDPVPVNGHLQAAVEVAHLA